MDTDPQPTPGVGAGSGRPASASLGSQILRALAAGAVVGMLAGTAIAFVLNDIPSENEQRFWLGIMVSLLMIATAVVVGLGALVVLLLRRSPVAAGVLAFAVALPVTADVVSRYLWQQEIGNVAYSQPGQGTMDLGPPISLNASGPLDCEQANGEDPASVLMGQDNIQIAAVLREEGLQPSLTVWDNRDTWVLEAESINVPPGSDGTITFTAHPSSDFVNAGAPASLSGTLTYDCP